MGDDVASYSDEPPDDPPEVNILDPDHNPDQEAFEAALNGMEVVIDEAISAAGQDETLVMYSAYESDENDVPVNNLNEVAVEGRVVLVQSKDKYWGGPDSKQYQSEVLENPTWLQVAVCANAMIAVTNDRHHVFLEGLTYCTTRDGVKVYRFSMGS